MVQPSWPLQQLYALWQQGQTRMARWFVGALAFVALVPLLVLTQYERTTRAASELTAKLVILESQSAESSATKQELIALRGGIEAVTAALDRFSATDRRNALIARMGALSEDWDAVRRIDDDALRRLAERGHAPDDRIQAPLNVRQFPNMPANMPAEREGALDPKVVETATTAALLARLELDPDELLKADQPGRAELARAAVVALADRAADEAVNSAAESMRAQVVKPMQDLVAAHPRVVKLVPDIEAVVTGIATDVEKWHGQFVKDTAWYSTVAGKEGAMRDLHAAMRHGPSLPDGPQDWTQRCRALVKAQEASVDKELNQLDAERSALNQSIASGREMLAQLSDKLKAILPKWIGDLVAPRELMQLYPAIVVVLVACIGVCAWRLRTTFVALRRAAQREQIPLDDIVDASTWTLARRGSLSTLATAAVYLGGIAIFWTFFAYGLSLGGSTNVALAQAGAALQTPESIVDALVGQSTIPSLGLVGHCVFALAAILVGATLVRDRAG